MTFKPMQNMHDLMKDGLIITLSDSPDEAWEATITKFNDRGHMVFLRMALETATVEATTD